MTFPSAAGYPNLPNGNWSPEIYSHMVQLAFRKKNVVRMISNSEYFGEIANEGDTVRIMKEPNIEVGPYVRGQQLRTQGLDDDEIVLVVDQANQFNFEVDDIEKKQSHIDFESVAADRGSYGLSNAMDREVLNYTSTQVGVTDGEIDLSGNKIGAAGAPVDLVLTGANGSTSFTALGILNRFKRLLDQQDVPKENRWFVGDPVFFEKLGDEDSKLLSEDYTSKGILDNGRITERVVRGFVLYESNNLPTAGEGPAGTTTSDHGVILAGHQSALATAEQLTKVESMRSTSSFADIVRGLHLYGRKVLRPESLVGAWYHSV